MQSHCVCCVSDFTTSHTCPCPPQTQTRHEALCAVGSTDEAKDLKPVHNLETLTFLTADMTLLLNSEEAALTLT